MYNTDRLEDRTSPTLPQTRFVTETAAPLALHYDEARKVLMKGIHPINTVVKEDGTIRYAQGTACIITTPRQEYVMLSTPDGENTVMEHRFRRPDGSAYHLSEDQLEVPRARRQIGADILGDGSTYWGRYLKERKIGEADSSHRHMLDVAAWKGTSHYLIDELLRDFTRFHRKELLNSGILLHCDPLVWTSREIVFNAKAEKTIGKFGRIVPKVNKDGEALYTLSKLAAPRKGWHASWLYHENHSIHKRGLLSSASRIVMRSLIRAISRTERGLTMAQVEDSIARDFAPMARRLRAGDLPFADENDRQPWTSAWFKGKLSTVFKTAVFGLNGITKPELFTGVGAPWLFGAGLAFSTEHELSALASAILPIPLAAMRFGSMWLDHSRRKVFDKIDFSDLAHHFWDADVNRRKLPHGFAMVRGDILPSSRVLSRREIESISRLPSNDPTTVPAWDTQALLDTLNGTYGSVGTPYKIGEQTVILMREDRVHSGLEIEYWPALGVAFAKNPRSPLLSPCLVNSFAASAKPIRMISVSREDGLFKGYDDRFLTQEEYAATVAQLKAVPAHDPLTTVPVDAKALDAYPLGPAGDEGHESWVKEMAESRDLSENFLDSLAEIAKWMLKGPRP